MIFDRIIKLLLEFLVWRIDGQDVASSVDVFSLASLKKRNQTIACFVKGKKQNQTNPTNVRQVWEGTGCG